MPSCPKRIKNECSDDTYCRVRVFRPRKEDGPKGLNREERQESSIKKMKNVNRNRPKSLKYKVIRNGNGEIVPVKNGGLGHIYTYACYPKHRGHEKFKENNSAYTEAFKNAYPICNDIELPESELLKIQESGDMTVGKAKRVKFGDCMRKSIKSQIKMMKMSGSI